MTLIQKAMLKMEFFWFHPKKTQIKYSIIAFVLWCVSPIVSYNLDYPERWFSIIIYLIISSVVFFALFSKTFISDSTRQQYKTSENEKDFNRLFKR